MSGEVTVDPLQVVLELSEKMKVLESELKLERGMVAASVKAVAAKGKAKETKSSRLNAIKECAAGKLPEGMSDEVFSQSDRKAIRVFSNYLLSLK